MLPPIRRQVVVTATLEVAFDVFTGEIGAWWPVGAGFSVFGEGADVTFRDGSLVERGPAGGESVWGRVLDWEPPRRLRMTWHPGSDPGKASEVEASFAPVNDAQTLVTVEHRGWERFADPVTARHEYDQGWPEVLRGYLERHGYAEPRPLGDPWIDGIPSEVVEKGLTLR